jgi:cytochrome c5
MKILLAVSLILLLSFGVCFRSRAGAHSKAALVVYALCFLNAVGIGYFGGELVFGTAKAVVQQNESSEPARATYADVGKIFSQSCTVCHSGSSPRCAAKLWKEPRMQ